LRSTAAAFGIGSVHGFAGIPIYALVRVFLRRLVSVPVIGPSLGFGTGAERCAVAFQKAFALALGESVYKQNPVQVIILMLNHARQNSIGIQAKRVSRFIVRLHGNLKRSANVGIDPGNAETALLIGPLIGRCRHDSGIYENSRLVIGNVNYEETIHATHLWSGEADTLLSVHRFHHRSRKRGQVLINCLHLSSDGSEAGVGMVH